MKRSEETVQAIHEEEESLKEGGSLHGVSSSTLKVLKERLALAGNKSFHKVRRAGITASPREEERSNGRIKESATGNVGYPISQAQQTILNKPYAATVSKEYLRGRQMASLVLRLHEDVPIGIPQVPGAQEASVTEEELQSRFKTALSEIQASGGFVFGRLPSGTLSSDKTVFQPPLLSLSPLPLRVTIATSSSSSSDAITSSSTITSVSSSSSSSDGVLNLKPVISTVSSSSSSSDGVLNLKPVISTAPTSSTPPPSDVVTFTPSITTVSSSSSSSSHIASTSIPRTTTVASSSLIGNPSTKESVDRLLDLTAKEGLEGLIRYRVNHMMGIETDDPEERLFHLLYSRLTRPQQTDN